jgi:hypothetical protein
VYCNNSYWYFTQGSTTLNKIPLNYSIPSVPTAGTKTIFTIAGITANQNILATLLLTASDILYGAISGGIFLSIDLANPTATYTQIKTGNPSLQLSFNADFKAHFTQNYAGEQWFKIKTSTGVPTAIPASSRRS